MEEIGTKRLDFSRKLNCNWEPWKFSTDSGTYLQKNLASPKTSKGLLSLFNLSASGTLCNFVF